MSHGETHSRSGSAQEGVWELLGLRRGARSTGRTTGRVKKTHSPDLRTQLGFGRSFFHALDLEGLPGSVFAFVIAAGLSIKGPQLLLHFQIPGRS